MNQLQSVIIEPEQHDISIIWLHGLGANGHDFEPIVPELHLKQHSKIRFIFPHAPTMPISINGGMVMNAWYDIQHPDLTQLEDSKNIQNSVKLIQNLIQNELDAGLDSKQILLAGFSQGGAIALYTGLTYEKPLAGILALSTYLPLQASISDKLQDANKDTSIMMMHGMLDPVIPIITAQQSYEKLQQLGLGVEWKTYPMAHSLCPQQITDIASWLNNTLASG